MILALTANGPGEFAGWVRPLLTALYARDPALDVRVFVPTTTPPGTKRITCARFPQATVYAPRDPRRAGARLDGLSPRESTACNIWAAT